MVNHCYRKTILNEFHGLKRRDFRDFVKILTLNALKKIKIFLRSFDTKLSLSLFIIVL